MNAVVAGALAASWRLKRASTAVAIAAAMLLVVIAALLERDSAALGAADRALAGGTFGIAFPLLCYVVVTRAVDGRNVDASLLSLARHGVDRRSSTLGLFVVTAGLLVVLGALLAATAVLVARGIGDAGVWGDLLRSASIGAGAGAAYAPLFLFGSTFGKFGGGRAWALGLDWILGSGATALAAPWPRSHVRSLLGAGPVLGMPQWTASLLLCGLIFAYLGLALWRSPR